MGNTWFTQLRHFLDDSGEFWDIKGPGRKLAEYLCSIVKAASSEILEIPIPTGIKCRRRPKRKPCKGEVYTFLDNEKSVIEWYCPVCKDNGYISDWENTKWDMRFSDILLVRLSLFECTLIKNKTLAGPDLTDRFDAANEVSNSITVYYTPDELEALLGFIAEEANHTSDKDLGEELDILYEGLEIILDSINLKTLH